MDYIKKHVIFCFFILSLSCYAFGNKTVAASKLPVQENREVLRLGMMNLMAGGAIQLAMEQGFFAGIDLKILSFSSAQHVATAIASGDVDIGQSGLTAAVYNLAGKEKLKIIAGASSETYNWPSAAYVVSNTAWNKGIRKPSQLQNVSLGITEKGSTFHYMAGLLADKYSFSLEEKIKLIPLATLPALRSALATSQIDSAILPSVVSHKVEEEKAGHIIGYVGNETPWQVTGVFASTKILKENPKLVKKYLAGFIKGCKYYHRIFNTEKPGLYATKEMLAKWPERENAATIISLFIKPVLDPVLISRFPVYIKADGMIDQNSIQHQIDWYKSRGMVEKGVTVGKVLNLNFLSPK
ncbi:MAG: ABC transporter substrate-binding protein [Candidatus Endonucleobacter bathymodioli]|uniref:ABC transporter substrate-binding protein n=1 Tax=Candidatus Endonucleibacter bathymodioli TaxID=539814 RepID=A0AA90SD43_9GAMM|nr:ABC transporter substrate-binding protein [Candidatus Endonucleobacter bathymodioli]